MTAPASTQADGNKYPGELASCRQVLELADEYRAAALALMARGKRGRPLTWAPFRLTAIQALELYLNALLLNGGISATEIRGMRHDLVARLDMAASMGLLLRLRTASHLHSLHRTREYLVTRYGPELANTNSQVNRLAATLDEVAKKVEKLCLAARDTMRPVGDTTRASGSPSGAVNP